MNGRSQMLVASMIGLASQFGVLDILPDPKPPRDVDPDKLAKQAAKLTRRAARYHRPQPEPQP